MSRRSAALLAPLLLAAAASAGAARVEVESHIDPPVVRVGEPAVFTIVVRTGLTDRVRLTAPLELEHLDLIAGPAVSESVRWGTGGSSRTVVLRWRLLARRTGIARVGPVPLEIGGEAIEAPGARLEVTDSTDGRSSVAPQRPTPFGLPRPERLVPPPEPRMLLRTEVEPRRPWTGGAVLYTLWIYTQAPFSRPSLESPPRFEGFWVDEVDLGNPAALAERVWYQGETWYRLPVLRRLIFPLRPGRHAIPPIQLSVESSGSPFDRRGLLHQRRRRIELRSEAVTVEARPLPEPPEGFSGAVGQLDLDARLVPGSIVLGEHATLELELAGRGNLQGVAPPELSIPEGLDLLPAEEDGGRRIAGTELTARHTWRNALVPSAAGSYRIPPVAITFFDPAAGMYRTASTRELVLDVAPAPPVVPETPASEPAETPATRRVPAAALWVAAALLLGALAGWGLSRRRSDGWLRRWRHQLERARSADRPRRAAAMLEESWRDLLAERWGLAHDLPPASWEEALLEAGADPRRAAEVGALAAELQALRHAPELSAVGALTEELIARSLAVARSIG